MKTTNATTSNINSNNGKPAFGIKTTEPVPVSQLIAQAKEKVNPEDVKTPTTYPIPTTKPEVAPQTEPAAKPEPVPATKPESAAAPEPEPAPQPMALMPVRSRSEEIQFQVDKANRLQLVNTQLVNLKGKHDELRAFSYNVDQSEDSRFGRLVIYDDANREFVCKNHGLAALVVDYLKGVFLQKIDEKETEFLRVSRS